ncbi:MAG: hypothetical protein ACJ8M4_03620 [Chthoniobacterales bacterium]
MQLRSPDLSLEQISAWMRLAESKPKAAQIAGGSPTLERRAFRRHPGFDFKSARQSLNRARSKNDIDTIKPLRRLRRNQGAINEALIDAFSALLAVNKQMASEIAALSADLAAARNRLADFEIAAAAGDSAGTHS